MVNNQKRLIFIDTSIFESENYFESRNINLLFHLAKEKLIEIKITDIVYREIKKRLSEHIIKAVNVFKKQKINFESEGRILRNVEVLKEHFEKKDFKSLKETAQIQILEKFEDIIKTCEIEILDIDISNITEVFEDYFETKPPFKEGLKKTEFPDAFSLNTIKQWCINNNKSCIFLSNDKDFEKYEEEKIDCSFNISTLLELLYKENSDIQFEFITKVYDNSLDEILYSIDSTISSSLESQVFEKIDNDPWFEDVDVNLREIENIDIQVAIINEIEEDSFTYEMDVDVEFIVDADYIDLNNAYYDREDNTWFGEERKSGIKRYRANILLYPHFEYNTKTNNGNFLEIDDYEIRDLDEI